MSKRDIKKYLDWVESNVYKNLETGEIVTYAGPVYDADTKERSIMIFRDNDEAHYITENEFNEKYKIVD